MKEQTSEMQKELTHIKGVNENLSLMVNDLKMRIYGMKKEVTTRSGDNDFNEKKIQAFQDAIFDCVQYI
jgi:hypothetical protein